MNLKAWKRSLLLFVFPALLAGSESFASAQSVPTPVLYFTGTEPFESGGKQNIRYRLDVLNTDDFPLELFASAPDLPPCGKNTRSSRTWVDIYALSGKRLNGFCALYQPKALRGIWFALEAGDVPPNHVYIELMDRKTNTKHKSTTAEIPVRSPTTDSSVKAPSATPSPSPGILPQSVTSSRPAETGHNYALVIGNNAYQHVRSLKTAEQDAKTVDAVLRERFGFDSKLVLNATRQDILSRISYYRRALGANDNLLIYYAGHGYFDREADKAYWLPVDARTDDNSNWISADDITSNIRAMPAQHVLVISDSCYSGTIYRGLELGMEPLGRERFLQKMSSGKSRTLMASGGNEPVADGGGGGHSVFARAFIIGLNQMGKDRFTATELFRDFVQERVAGGANQTPEYNPLRNSGHDSGDFVFSRKQ